MAGLMNEPHQQDLLQNNIEVLAELTNRGLPVVHVFPKKFACMSYLLFDIEEFFMDEKQTRTELQLKIKNLGNGRFDLVFTNDNCGMERWEEFHTFEHATVDGAVAASTTVVLNDITLLKGMGINTRIRFHTEAAPFAAGNPGDVIAVVTNIAGNTITLDVPVTLNDGDKAYRGANLRVRCGDIDNKYDRNRRANYKSYPQSLHGDINFETCDLSVDRAVYHHGMGDTPQILINSKINDLLEGLVKNEFMDIFLYGRNRPESAPDASETRGLLWSINDAQIATGETFIINLAPGVGTTDDEQVIACLIEYFVKAFNSGYYSNEPITAIINSEQLKQLMYMAPSFQEFFGIQFYRETESSHEGCRDYVSLRVHGIEIEHGTIEFVLFEPLNHFWHETPIMILIPRSMYGFYQRRFAAIDANLKIIESSKNGTFPTFKFKDISDIVNARAGRDECYTYNTNIEFILAQAGVYNCAYYVIKNAKSYRQCSPSSFAQTDVVIG